MCRCRPFSDSKWKKVELCKDYKFCKLIKLDMHALYTTHTPGTKQFVGDETCQLMLMHDLNVTKANPYPLPSNYNLLVTAAKSKVVFFFSVCMHSEKVSDFYRMKILQFLSTFSFIYFGSCYKLKKILGQSPCYAAYNIFCIQYTSTFVTSKDF